MKPEVIKSRSNHRFSLQGDSRAALINGQHNTQLRTHFIKYLAKTLVKFQTTEKTLVDQSARQAEIEGGKMSIPREYSGYVSAKELEMLADISRSLKERSYQLMQIQPGHRVLDVGCGPAIDTIPLVQFVSSMGQVVGVDYDEAMVRKANQKAKAHNVEQWVTHKYAEASSLPFEENYFDSCRSERLFQHLLQPDLALKEMIRVTKSGGLVVVADSDHGSVSIDTPTGDVDIERRFTRLRAELLVNNGFAGRQLYRQFKCHGLQDVSLELFGIPFTSFALLKEMDITQRTEALALATGTLTQIELDHWRTRLEQADADGVFFASSIMVMVAGRKP